MKIAVLLKSKPYTDETARALQTVSDLLSSGHDVTLYLLQEAVRFCQPRAESPDSLQLQALIDNGLEVYALDSDTKLRGIDTAFIDQDIMEGSYDSLVELMESCDRVVGIL